MRMIQTVLFRIQEKMRMSFARMPNQMLRELRSGWMMKSWRMCLKRRRVQMGARMQTAHAWCVLLLCLHSQGNDDSYRKRTYIPSHSVHCARLRKPWLRRRR